jgi:POT family proton-dependent oligopeptide transporter
MAAPSTGFFGHPAGLSTVFFVELWERFSYYGMRALLILFMTASAANGGLGLDVGTAGAIYGMYTSAVYMLSLPGGWLADRILGQRRTVFIGGVFIACGQFCLAAPWTASFYFGLLLIVLGTGMLKPNASTIVGKLYAPGDVRRDAGFSIFYMGINTGAFVSPLIVGWVGQRVDWHLGFALAGLGMVVGLIQYSFGGKRLGDAGLYPVPPADEAEARRQKVQLRLGLIGLAAVLVVVGTLAALGIATPVGIANVFGILLLFTVAGSFGFLILGGNWTPVERKRLAVTFVFFVAASIFWSEFEQAGSTMNLFADRSTRNEILGFSFPASWLQAVNALFIIAFAPVFAWIWLKLGRRDPSSPAKFALGLISLGAGFAILSFGAMASASGQRVSPMWLIVTYLLHTVGELCLSPVGLSAMTKLAPVRVAGLVMGMWFLSNAMGNYLGGRLASFYESFPLPLLFGVVAGVGLASGLIMAVLTPSIKRLLGGVK